MRSAENKHLAKRFELRLHDEVKLAEFTAASVGGFDPLVETSLVDETKAPGAVTGRDQGAVVITLTVADPTHRQIGTRCYIC